jgi:hypothetical protein
MALADQDTLAYAEDGIKFGLSDCSGQFVEVAVGEDIDCDDPADRWLRGVAIEEWRGVDGLVVAGPLQFVPFQTQTLFLRERLEGSTGWSFRV